MSGSIEVGRSSMGVNIIIPNQSQDRLKSHARAFDGLLELIPAKIYHGEEISVRAPDSTFRP